MGWTSTGGPTSNRSFYLDDKPMILSHHAIRDSVGKAVKWGVAGTTASTDVTRPQAPVSRLWDGYAHPGLHTLPTTANSFAYLVFDFSAAPISFDSIVIHGVNLSETDTLEVQIADDGAFTVRPATVASVAPSSARAVLLELDHLAAGWSRAYSAVEYVRIKFTESLAITPRVSEAWFGNHRQLHNNPEEPWSRGQSGSAVASGIAKSGVATQAHRVRGRALRDISLLATTSSDINVIDGLWDDTLGGTQPFYWIETPSSDPKAYLMRLRDAEINPRLVGPTHRRVSLPMIEQNPYVATEV